MKSQVGGPLTACICFEHRHSFDLLLCSVVFRMTLGILATRSFCRRRKGLHVAQAGSRRLSNLLGATLVPLAHEETSPGALSTHCVAIACIREGISRFRHRVSEGITSLILS